MNNDYIIIQIDSDVSENFEVSHNDENNNKLPIETLVNRIKQKLISKIDSDFYEENQHKIIFAVSVHSLECWILPIYQPDESEAIDDCYENLKTAVLEKKNINIKKTYRWYNTITESLLVKDKLTAISNKSKSLEIFINALPQNIAD